MPGDWNDHAGWDRYYQSLVARPLDEWTLRTGSMPIEQLPAIAEDMKTRGWRLSGFLAAVFRRFLTCSPTSACW